VIFLTRLAKGNVSFCHHLASVVLTFHILIFSSETAAVSEEKIFLEINQSETRIAYGGHVC
jgi:hypothetical protein